MAKIYQVEVPEHSGGGKYKVTANNEARVKEMLCKKLGRTRVPKGTIIKKIGLTKSKEKTEEQLDPKKDSAATQPAQPAQPAKEDSLKSRSRKPAAEKKTSSKKLVKDLNSYQKKLYNQQKQEEKEEKEKENSACAGGIYLNYDNQVKLKSKMDITFSTLYIEEDDGVSVLYVGEDAAVTLKRGTKFWLYIDHTEDNINQTSLLDHI